MIGYLKVDTGRYVQTWVSNDLTGTSTSTDITRFYRDQYVTYIEYDSRSYSCKTVGPVDAEKRAKEWIRLLIWLHSLEMLEIILALQGTQSGFILINRKEEYTEVVTWLVLNTPIRASPWAGSLMGKCRLCTPELGVRFSFCPPIL